MVSKFNLNDLVIYDSKIYIVKAILVADWSLKNPFVYSLQVFNPKYSKLQNNLLLIKEDYIEKASEKQINSWKILYEMDFN